MESNALQVHETLPVRSGHQVAQESLSPLINYHQASTPHPPISYLPSISDAFSIGSPAMSLPTSSCRIWHRPTTTGVLLGGSPPSAVGACFPAVTLNLARCYANRPHPGQCYSPGSRLPSWQRIDKASIISTAHLRYSRS